MSSKKLSRKEIKETVRHDELQTAVSTTVEEVKSHQKELITLIVVVVAAVLLGSAIRVYLKHRDAAAAETLADAMRVYHAPVVESDADPDDPRSPSFASDEERKAKAREALEEVDAGVAGDVASLYEAILKLEEGDADAARARWQAFVDAHQGHVLAFAAERNIIRLDRDAGRGEEVVERLKAKLDAKAPDLPEDMILFELAETLDALDKKDEAKTYYQRILDDYPRSAFAGKARQKTS